MTIKSVFQDNTVNELISRIEKVSADTKPLWGKMDAARMFAHLNVMYEMVYENKHPKAGPIKRFFITLLAKRMVVGDKPYPRNLRTAPAFVIRSDRNFELEKSRLIAYLRLTKQHGESYFDGRESLSFGKLTIREWNTLFYKHLDHHLTQFRA